MVEQAKNQAADPEAAAIDNAADNKVVGATANEGGNNANENSAISFLSSSNSDSDDFNNEGREGQNDTRRGRRGQGTRSRRRRSPGGSPPGKAHRSSSEERKEFQTEGRRDRRSRSRENSAEAVGRQNNTDGNQAAANAEAGSEGGGHHRTRRDRSNGSHQSRTSSQDRKDGRRRSGAPRSKEDGAGTSNSRGRDVGTSGNYKGRGNQRDGGDYAMHRGFRYPSMSKPLLSMPQFSQLQQNRHGDPASFRKEYKFYQEEHGRQHAEAFCKVYEREPWFMEQFNPMSVYMAKMDHCDLVRTRADKFFARIPFNLLDLTKRDDGLTDGPQVHKFDANSRTIYLKQIPAFVARVQLKEAVSSVTTGLEQIIMSRPLQTQKFERFAWLVYNTDEQCESAMTDLETLVIRAPRESYAEDFKLGPIRNNTTVKPAKVTPELPQDHIPRDIELCKRLIKEVYDVEKEIDFPFEKLETEVDSQDAKLDTLLLYLRQVHGFCLYCGIKCEDERQLVGKCASQHLRQRPVELDRAAFNQSVLYGSSRQFEATYVAQAEKLLAKGPDEKPLDPKEDGYLIEKNHKYCMEKTRTVVDGKKYVCMLCDKAFKSIDFVVKHIANKHADRIMSKNISFFKDQARQSYRAEYEKNQPAHSQIHQQPAGANGAFNRQGSRDFANNAAGGFNRQGSGYGGQKRGDENQSFDGGQSDRGRGRGGYQGDFGGRGGYQNRNGRGGGYMGDRQGSNAGQDDGAAGMDVDQGEKRKEYVDYDDPMQFDGQGQKTQIQQQVQQQQPQMPFYKQGGAAQASTGGDRQLVSYDDLF